MTLINVDNVLSGLGSYGIDSNTIYDDIKKSCDGDLELALEDYLNKESPVTDLNVQGDILR